jgi:hypothetical protein
MDDPFHSVALFGLIVTGASMAFPAPFVSHGVPGIPDELPAL